MFSKKKRTEEKPLELNISSLMDIMTILLLFLLMSFESQEQKTEPPADIELPPSYAERPVKLAVKVSISTEEIRVEDNIVVKLQNGKFPSRVLESDEKTITPLLKELKRQKARLQSGATSTTAGEEDESEIVYFEAGKGTHYDIVDKVMKTAAGAGFTKFRLAVQKRF